MSSDTDSSTDSSISASSDSSAEYKKRKLSKKRKNKMDKKEKKHKKQKKNKSHKEKIRSRKESKSSVQQSISVEANEDCFGPALPPHLKQTLSEPSVTKASASASIIGPVLPINENAKLPKQNESDNEIDIGPLPLNNDNLSAVEVEREKRALELKIAVLEGRSLRTNTNEEKTREEWMLELPEVGLKGGLAALSNLKRTFHTGKDKPDFSDRSSWTKTPQSESKDRSVVKPKVNEDDLKSKAQDLYERARDAEQEQLAKKHKKKHKRDESLMDLHQKQLRKAEKQKEKELAASGSKPERRPFSRDVDLKLNKIDKNQTKQIVDKAKILNSKFSSGKTKYL